jgi:hypothetical protein
MSMPKRRLPPDTRLDWRDKNMPVLRYGNFNGVLDTKEVSAKDITNYYKAKLEQLGWQMPDYDKDPSYWWNRKGKGK